MDKKLLELEIDNACLKAENEALRRVIERLKARLYDVEHEDVELEVKQAMYDALFDTAVLFGQGARV